MNPQYTHVKVEGPSFPTKGQPVMNQKEQIISCQKTHCDIVHVHHKTSKSSRKQVSKAHNNFLRVDYKIFQNNSKHIALQIPDGFPMPLELHILHTSKSPSPQPTGTTPRCTRWLPRWALDTGDCEPLEVACLDQASSYHTSLHLATNHFLKNNIDHHRNFTFLIPFNSCY